MTTMEEIRKENDKRQAHCAAARTLIADLRCLGLANEESLETALTELGYSFRLFETEGKPARSSLHYRHESWGPRRTEFVSDAVIAMLIKQVAARYSYVCVGVLGSTVLPLRYSQASMRQYILANAKELEGGVI